MRAFAALPISLGAVLIVWVFLVEEIYTRHAIQSYLLLCTGFICLSIGCSALAMSRTSPGR